MRRASTTATPRLCPPEIRSRLCAGGNPPVTRSPIARPRATDSQLARCLRRIERCGPRLHRSTAWWVARSSPPRRSPSLTSGLNLERWALKLSCFASPPSRRSMARIAATFSFCSCTTSENAFCTASPILRSAPAAHMLRDDLERHLARPKNRPCAGARELAQPLLDYSRSICSAGTPC